MSNQYDLDPDSFAHMVRTIPMRDGFGRLTPGEKSGMAAMGDRWVLALINPQTLEPVAGRPRKRRAIIYSAMGDDILDGRHRRCAAQATGEPISAWVGLDMAQYERWKATGTWLEVHPETQPTRARKNRP